ncbi:MAG: hypothetical protein JNK29_01005, partial [Anaerolineales bacterium]|nr:hypothetical protein [Anaerolineales bacterium]
MRTLLIKDGIVLPGGDGRLAHSPGYVFIRGERVEAVGAGAPPEGLAAAADEILSAAGQVVLPGLVNAHT